MLKKKNITATRTFEKRLYSFFDNAHHEISASGVIFKKLSKATKGLRVKQTRMSVFCQRDLTLIEYKIKKTDLAAHLGHEERF